MSSHILTPFSARSSASIRLSSRLIVLCVYWTRFCISPPFLTKSLFSQAAHEDVIPLNEPVTTASGEAVDQITVGAGMSLIIPIRAINRSDAFWGPDAKEFKPERWLKDGRLDPDVRDSGTTAFGYGRRICPGRHFAVSSLFMVVSTVLHTLSISAPVDEEGRSVPLSGKMTSGLLS